MIIDKKKPYVIYLAEIIYKNIVNIKENGFFSEYENIKKHHLEEHATT